MADISEHIRAMKGYFERVPFNALIGIDIVELEPDYCKIRLPFKPDMARSYGVVHGGVVASLIDVAAGVATMSTFPVENGRIVVKGSPATIEMKINYLAPLMEEDATGEGRVISRGKSIAVSDVEVRGAKGDLVAKALVTYKLPRQEGSTKRIKG